MNIPVHHNNNGEANTYFRCCNNHNKENEQLTIRTRRRVGSRVREMMHF